jgi:hypothetical protein
MVMKFWALFKKGISWPLISCHLFKKYLALRILAAFPKYLLTFRFHHGVHETQVIPLCNGSSESLEERDTGASFTDSDSDSRYLRDSLVANAKKYLKII